ncbi:hypothetical protein L5515_011205 [Caenorhabditis briggsae]|uniref:Uncharacterized protein n=1 Tax=Caenorhabditis briggsae TaxID=6238 RepID=A0AAE9JE41_CAEBR|nr:hypothetical protein L5515_011205 [Caenorhabditis briggsae]
MSTFVPFQSAQVYEERLNGSSTTEGQGWSLESGSTYKSRNWETESSKSSCGGHRVMMSVCGTVEPSVVDISQPEASRSATCLRTRKCVIAVIVSECSSHDSTS